MKRRLLMVMLLLVASAIVNVAVAWGCGLWLPYAPFAALGPAESWPAQVPPVWPQEPRRLWQAKSSAIVLTLTDAQDPNDSMRGFMYARVATGWPCRSMQMDFLSERYMSNPRQIVERRGSFDGGSASGLAAWTDPKMPYRGLSYSPIWPGFAINTVFYATIFWALFAVPAALRRKRRIKRGLCPKCAYPVGESEVCTECGAPHAVKPALRSRAG